MTTRRVHADQSCVSCGQPIGFDETVTQQTARHLPTCRSCARGPAPDGGESQPAAGTIRMRALRKTASSDHPAVALAELPIGMTVALEVTDGPQRGSVHRLRRRVVVVGREQGEVVIPDPGISRRHASIEVLDLDTVILRDLSSTNGTYHNDQLIAFCKVQDGDEIRIGGTTLTVSIDLLG